MEDYEKIEQAIVFLENNYRQQPTLQEIADHISLSKFHAQRLFKRWAGITPKRFSQYLTLGYAKSVLEHSGSLLDAAYDSGLSGTGRLYDLFVTFEAVTPGEYKQKGENVLIRYGIQASPFGSCLLGITERGICWLSFFGIEGPDRSLEEMAKQWPGAEYKEDRSITVGYMDKIFKNRSSDDQKNLGLYIRGTNFQIKVWEALLKLPPGKLVSYKFLAESLKKPQAVRAIASAVGKNPVSFLIPCHRVLRKSGNIAGYRWGTTRKKAIITWEAAHYQKEIQHGS